MLCFVMPRYQHFKVAVYVPVHTVRSLADPDVFNSQWSRAAHQLAFDKVYIEVYRNHVAATDGEISAVKQAFEARGVEVSGGLTLAAGGEGGQFSSFDYESPADRAECKAAVEKAARHFDEIILDDFFFFSTRSDADIAAKGGRSWTKYRLDTMRKVSKELVLEPARQVNPGVKVLLKYPNWYEHFQGLGYDLAVQPGMFDGIYTGTETRDPIITDQLLQQYQSYEIFRYLSNIGPATKNGGGWVDTFSITYIDRYAEQLWDTLFARAPEITLFTWGAMSDRDPVSGGDRAAWENLDTSFNWEAIKASYVKQSNHDPGPGWGFAASRALRAADEALGALGRPVGVMSYKPFPSSGEDYLHNYLGNMGVPIEMTSRFPGGKGPLLLTQAAAADPNILDMIKDQLKAGRSIFVTSGFVKATQSMGFQSLVEVRPTGMEGAADDYFASHGSGKGVSLRDDPEVAPRAILFPELHFFTNDAWPLIRGIAGARGLPVLLMTRYSRGTLYILTIPQNIGDLYALPRGVMSRLKTYLQKGAPVRVHSPAGVALFTYDNGSFIVQSFRDEPATITISLSGQSAVLLDQLGAAVPPSPLPIDPGAPGASLKDDPRTEYSVTILPHSFQVYRRQ